MAPDHDGQETKDAQELLGEPLHTAGDGTRTVVRLRRVPDSRPGSEQGDPLRKTLDRLAQSGERDVESDVIGGHMREGRAGGRRLHPPDEGQIHKGCRASRPLLDQSVQRTLGYRYEQIDVAEAIAELVGQAADQPRAFDSAIRLQIPDDPHNQTALLVTDVAGKRGHARIVASGRSRAGRLQGSSEHAGIPLRRPRAVMAWVPNHSTSEQAELVEGALRSGDDRLGVGDSVDGFFGIGVIAGGSGYSSSLRRRRSAPNWRKPGPKCARAPRSTA